MANPTAYDQVQQLIANRNNSIAERSIQGMQTLADSRLPDIGITAAINNMTSKTWIFPSDLPKHHFIIQQYKAITLSSRVGLEQLKPSNTIYLPMPSQIIDSKNINYNNGFNLFKALAPKTLQETILGPASQTIQAITGLGLNNMNAVTLDLPDFQKFTLDFHLAPKSPKESLEINNIVRLIRKYSHPVNILGRALLGFPSIWQMSFHQDDYLFKFKGCVIENIQVTYPNNFFQVNGTVPENVNIHLQCMELEPWLEEDYLEPERGPEPKPRGG